MNNKLFILLFILLNVILFSNSQKSQPKIDKINFSDYDSNHLTKKYNFKNLYNSEFEIFELLIKSNIKDQVNWEYVYINNSLVYPEIIYTPNYSDYELSISNDFILVVEYINETHKKYHISKDGGISWSTSIHVTLQGFKSHPKNPNLLLAFVNSANYNFYYPAFSIDFGETWKILYQYQVKSDGVFIWDFDLTKPMLYIQLPGSRFIKYDYISGESISSSSSEFSENLLKYIKDSKNVNDCDLIKSDYKVPGLLIKQVDDKTIISNDNGTSFNQLFNGNIRSIDFGAYGSCIVFSTDFNQESNPTNTGIYYTFDQGKTINSINIDDGIDLSSNEFSNFVIENIDQSYDGCKFKIKYQEQQNIDHHYILDLSPVLPSNECTSDQLQYFDITDTDQKTTLIQYYTVKYGESCLLKHSTIIKSLSNPIECNYNDFECDKGYSMQYLYTNYNQHSRTKFICVPNDQSSNYDTSQCLNRNSYYEPTGYILQNYNCIPSKLNSILLTPKVVKCSEQQSIEDSSVIPTYSESIDTTTSSSNNDDDDDDDSFNSSLDSEDLSLQFFLLFLFISTLLLIFTLGSSK